MLQFVNCATVKGGIGVLFKGEGGWTLVLYRDVSNVGVNIPKEEQKKGKNAVKLEDLFKVNASDQARAILDQLCSEKPNHSVAASVASFKTKKEAVFARSTANIIR